MYAMALSSWTSKTLERVELLFVEGTEMFRHDRPEQDPAVRGTARGQVEVLDRDTTRRHVPARVTHVELGEQHAFDLGARQAAWPQQHRRAEASDDG